MTKKLHRRSRRIHRILVPFAAAPLALTSLSGAIYGTILDWNMDAPWLLKLHTGNYGVINLQPIYSPLIGVLTLLLVGSGAVLLLNKTKPVQSSHESS